MDGGRKRVKKHVFKKHNSVLRALVRTASTELGILLTKPNILPALSLNQQQSLIDDETQCPIALLLTSCYSIAAGIERKITLLANPNAREKLIQVSILKRKKMHEFFFIIAEKHWSTRSNKGRQKVSFLETLQRT